MYASSLPPSVSLGAFGSTALPSAPSLPFLDSGNFIGGPDSIYPSTSLATLPSSASFNSTLPVDAFLLPPGGPLARLKLEHSEYARGYRLRPAYVPMSTPGDAPDTFVLIANEDMDKPPVPVVRMFELPTSYRDARIVPFFESLVLLLVSLFVLSMFMDGTCATAALSALIFVFNSSAFIDSRARSPARVRAPIPRRARR